MANTYKIKYQLVCITHKINTIQSHNIILISDFLKRPFKDPKLKLNSSLVIIIRHSFKIITKSIIYKMHKNSINKQFYSILINKNCYSILINKKSYKDKSRTKK